MYKVKKLDIYVAEIAELLGKKLIGENFIVNYPITLNNIRDSGFLFFDGEIGELVSAVKNHASILVLIDRELQHPIAGITYIVVDNPKLAYISLINEYFIEYDPVTIAASAIISNNAAIGRSVSIGENTVIGDGVTIGNNTRLCNNVVVKGPVKIGSNCLIRDNTTIGGEAFDFITTEKDSIVQVPHIGGIEIGNNVWIGSNVSIERGIFTDTVIYDGVKIDDLVQIGASSIIGVKSLVTAGTIISRNVTINENCLIAPNSSIREGLLIGKDSIIGIGSVVVKNVESNSVNYGNPATKRK